MGGGVGLQNTQKFKPHQRSFLLIQDTQNNTIYLELINQQEDWFFISILMNSHDWKSKKKLASDSLSWPATWAMKGSGPPFTKLNPGLPRQS